MDKQLEQAIKSVSGLMQIKSSVMTIGAYFHHIERSQEEETSITKYAQNTLEELIRFARIEKMYDLGIIDNDKKEELYKDYNEYQKLRLVIGTWDAEKIFAEFEEREPKDMDEDDSLKERCKNLEDKLTSYGIISELNYEEAIMNQVDKEVKQKRKLKKKI